MRYDVAFEFALDASALVIQNKGIRLVLQIRFKRDKRDFREVLNVSRFPVRNEKFFPDAARYRNFEVFVLADVAMCFGVTDVF